MIRIIARNSAPISRNRPAAQTKARMRNRTEWTGFLATMTAKAEATRTGAKIQKNKASACIVSLSFSPSPLAGERGWARGVRRASALLEIALRRGPSSGRQTAAEPDPAGLSAAFSLEREKTVIDTARPARCCAPTPVPSDRRWPAIVACRNKALRASRSRIRNSALRRSHRPGRPPGTCRSRCT